MESNGQKLKKIRLEKGLNLEEVQKKTKVHINILKAIEGDSISNLSPIYLKSFIKIYCGFLGVDYKEYVLDEKEQKPQIAEIKNKETLLAKEPRKSSYLDAKPIALGASDFGKNIKIAIIIVIAVSIFSLVLFSLGKMLSSKQASVSSKKIPAKTAVRKKEVKKVISAQETKVPAATPKLQEIPLKPRKDAITSINLGIRAREDCFVHLKVDGKVVFHRILEKGRFENWEGKNRMELSIGNAGAVELEVNGQLFSKLGRRGESKKGILITREGVTIP